MTSPVPPTPPQPQLRVLSLNCWGLKFVAERRRERLLAIADWIGNSASIQSRHSYHSDGSDDAAGQTEGYDVIALQEIWVREDFEVVAVRAKAAGLLYSRFFYSGAIGSGLALLSAHPISTSFIFPYPLCGFPLHFIEGDFYAAKAVCGICIDVPRIGKVDVLNTHMYAQGGEAEGVDGAHRVAQAWELARIVTEKSERGRHVIVMGDLNSQPDSIIIRLLSTHGSLLDAFAQTQAPPPSITSSAHRALTPLEVIHTHGITCDSPLNTYSAAKLAKRSPHSEEVIRGGKRLDYVLYRSPEGGAQLVAEKTRVVLTELIPALGCSYSDHFGLEAVLSLVPTGSTSTESGHLVADRPPPLTPMDLTQGITNLTGAYRHSLASSSAQLYLFALALVLTPAWAIAASFQPLRYLGWLFVLLGVATGAGGATMLYSGLIGGRWEAGALRNVIGEMEAELDRMRGTEGGRSEGAGGGTWS